MSTLEFTLLLKRFACWLIRLPCWFLNVMYVLYQHFDLLSNFSCCISTTNQNQKISVCMMTVRWQPSTSALLPFAVYPAAQPLQGTDFHGLPLEYFSTQPTTYLSEGPIIGMIQSWTKLKHTMRITLPWFSRQITTRSYRPIRQSCDECVLVWSGHQESNLDWLLRRQIFYPLNYGQIVCSKYLL